MLVLPNGLPGTKIRESLSKEEVKLVNDFEEWCHRRGLIMDIICNSCLDEGHERASRCFGDNTRNSGIFRINCAHAERVYGVAV